MDRMAERRDDPEWLDEAYHHPEARLLLAHRGRLLVRYQEAGAPLLAFRAADLSDRISYSAFLGRRRECSYFMASVEADEAASIAEMLDAEFGV